MFALAVAVFGTLLPVRSYAHGSEFLLAKVCLNEPGQVRIEMTADYGSNPMISSEDEAEAALKAMLQIRTPSGPKALDTFASPRFEKHSQFDSTSPLAAGPVNEKDPHELMTGTWSWRTSEKALVFEVPKGNPQNVVLWTDELRKKDGKPPFLFLIAGDFTPPISIHQLRLNWKQAGLGLAGFALIAASVTTWVRRRKRSIARSDPYDVEEETPLTR